MLGALWAQLTTPVSKALLIKRLETEEAVLPTPDLVLLIQRDGVDFAMTPEIEDDLLIAAGRGGRSETAILELMSVVRGACRSCSAPGPLDPEEALRLLASRGGPAEVARQFRTRGAGDGFEDPAFARKLQDAGAPVELLRVLFPKPPALLSEGMERLPLRQSEDYDEDRPSGYADIKLDIDAAVDIRVVYDTLSYILLRGAPAANAGSQYSQPVPRAPLDHWTYRWKKVGGRSDVRRVTPLAANEFGCPGFQIVIDDTAAGSGRYHVRIEWDWKPFTLVQIKEILRQRDLLGDAAVARMIRSRRVGFRVDAQVDGELRAAGADNKLIGEIAAAFSAGRT
ncbi:MAG: hypothetical protein KIT09_00700 [Bryobacteraceae bacterium]|nr:hypothetical protein [Bryobacteraceae bacterium]